MGLYVIATRQALVTYRAAFKAGRLGTVHQEVAHEVLSIGADVLWSRAELYRRIQLTWAGLSALVALATGTAWIGWPGAEVPRNLLLGALAVTAFEYAGARGARRAYASACIALAGATAEPEEPPTEGDEGES